MSSLGPQNIAASVRQKLLNHSREQNEDFQLILTRFALERLLFRLSRSKHADNFVLKGAFLFLIWADQPYRQTRDLDLLGLGESSTEQLIAIFKGLCNIDQDDGLIFLPDSISADEIRDNQEYNGVRLRLMAKLEAAQISLQIDIGFGDIVTPQPQRESLPTILDMPAPCILIYSKESVVSEKYEAMVRLGIVNSRMKDFYDVWMLATDFDSEGQNLLNAIRATFERRNTPLPKRITVALSAGFVQDTAKQMQWRAFLNRTRLRAASANFTSVIDLIRSFVLPPTEALSQGRAFDLLWPAGGLWR